MVKKDKAHHHGVFKSSIRILFEVAQATLVNWTTPTPEEGGSQNLYVEVFLDRKLKTKCRCLCRRKKKKKKNKEEERGRTATIPEGREMRWRKFNEEQYLMALFTLGGHKLKVAEGEQVNLFAEVFRQRAHEENGQKVAVMRGCFKAGVLGQVTLWSTEATSGEREDELEGIPHLVLELRPTSSRSFILAEAQPHCKEETIESLRAEMAIQKNTFRRMGNKRLSAVLNAGRRFSVGGNDSHAAEYSHASDHTFQPQQQPSRTSGRAIPSAVMFATNTSPSGMYATSTGGGTGTFNSTGTSVILERESRKMPSLRNPPVGQMTSTATESSQRHSIRSETSENQKPESARKLRFSGIENPFAARRSNQPRVSGSETPGGHMSSLATLVQQAEQKTSRFNILKALKRKKPLLELRSYDSWLVVDWPATWRSPWPVESDDLNCKWDVMPLMESEFRRDCVLFFNTIFPRVQCEAFQVLRLQALTRTQKKPKPTTPRPLDSKSFCASSILSLPSSSPKKVLAALLPPKEIEDVEGDVEIEVRSTISIRSIPSLDEKGLAASFSLGSNCKVPKLTVTPAGRRYLLGPEPDANGFCANNGNVDLLVNLLDDYAPRIWFLKRLYICFAVCGVYQNEGGNSAQIGDLWPYPLASLLGHGSRILIRLEDVEGSEFLNFLLTGDPNYANWKESRMPPPLKARAAATHACLLQTETGHLLEKKLHTTNAKDIGQNILDGINKKHLGLNMPIGGAGNPAPKENQIIGFTGKVYQNLEGISKKKRFKRLRALGKAITNAIRPPPSEKTPKKKSGTPLNGSAMEGLLGANSGGSEADAETSDHDMHLRSPTKGEINKSFNLAETDMPEWMTKRRSRPFRQLRNVQSGHLYIRIDDFGEQVCRHCGEDSALLLSSREEEIRKLREKTRKGLHPLERAIMRRTIESRSHSPGEIFFPESVPILPHDRPEHHVVGSGDQESGDSFFHRLLRISSEPSLHTHAGVDASEDDIKWVNKVLGRGSNQGTPVSLKPPSASALRLLLHHHNPLGTHLFGTANFKSVEDLFGEVSEQTSCIFIDKTGALQRFVEPVVLQLRFRGRLLMLSHEHFEGKAPRAKNSFICTQIEEDQSWKDALRKVLMEKLAIDVEVLEETLEGFSRNDENSHAIIQEAMVSPSYPGLMCHYRTHMVQWEISEECNLEVFSGYGLPINLSRRKKNRYKCDFVTIIDQEDSRSGTSGTLYWTWMPEVEARKLQCWVNLGETSPDEKWARHAFQREGAVQFPPTEQALTILLQRCGIDVSLYGSGTRSLTALWRELTNQEGFLQMQNGQPLLAVEAILVLVRWRRKRDDNFDILVQIREEHPDGRVNDNQKLLGGRKLKEDSWSNAAIRCVMERLQLTRQQVTNMLAHRPDDASEYTFVEERQEASTFPGVDTIYRTHLVTYTLKEDVAHTLAGRTTLGLPVKANVAAAGIAGIGSSMAVAAGVAAGAGSKTAQWEEFQGEDDEIPTERMVEVQIATPYGSQVIEFKWLHANDAETQEVIGMNLFTMAKQREERHSISSVLLGLEGADPGNVSAFGCGHDASGQPAKISASGGRKWRAYRFNNAPQIPADIGGMRMKVNKSMFAELIDACEKLDLLDPGLDILWEQGVSYPRELLNHKYAEKELIKQILSCNGQQAKKAIEWMKGYRAKYKTLTQVHTALNLDRTPPVNSKSSVSSRRTSASSKCSTRTHVPDFEVASPRQHEFSIYQHMCVAKPTLPFQPHSGDQFLPSCPARNTNVQVVPTAKILPSHPFDSPYIAPSFRKAKGQ